MSITTSPGPRGRATVFCGATAHSPQSSGAINTTLTVEIELDLEKGTVVAVYLDPRLQRLQGIVVSKLEATRSEDNSHPEVEIAEACNYYSPYHKFLAQALSMSSAFLDVLTQPASEPEQLPLLKAC
jgi:hypothetical protein